MLLVTRNSKLEQKYNEGWWNHQIHNNSLNVIKSTGVDNGSDTGTSVSLGDEMEEKVTRKDKYPDSDTGTDTSTDCLNADENKDNGANDGKTYSEPKVEASRGGGNNWWGKIVPANI